MRQINKEKFITVVSGLPRSGTSLLMQMLQAGGMNIYSDNLRTADTDNPLGYFESEKVKSLPQSAAWLDEVAGKAVKVISWLLPNLPGNYHYKIIFMERDLNEIIASQNKMLRRKNAQPGQQSAEQLFALFSKHLSVVKKQIRQTRFMEIIFVDYRDLIDHPQNISMQIARFLGADLNITAMIKAVQPQLYRNRLESQR